MWRAVLARILSVSWWAWREKEEVDSRREEERLAKHTQICGERFVSGE